MGPRKRSRPNPKGEEPLKVDREEQAKPTLLPTVGVVADAAAVLSKAKGPSNTPDAPDTADVVDSVRSSRGWYSGGTWPRIQKSTPSTKVARETILAAKSSTTALSADFSRFEPKKADDLGIPQPNTARPSSMDPGKSKNTVDVTVSDGLHSASIPSTSSATDSSAPHPEEHPDKIPSTAKEKPKITPGENTATKDLLGTTASGSTPLPPLQRPITGIELSGSNQGNSPRPTTSYRWPGWWINAGQTSESLQTPVSGLTNDESCPKDDHTATEGVSQDSPRTEPERAVDPGSTTNGSWFRIWPSSNAPKTTEVLVTTPEASQNVEPEILSDGGVSTPTHGSSWAFWSKQSDKSKLNRTEAEEPGELAVTGEASQDQPIPARTSTVKDTRLDTVKHVKRGRQYLSDNEETSQKVEKPDSKSSPSQSPSPPQPIRPNLLLPSFGGTYRLVENPSIIQQIARLLMKTQQPPANHVFLVKEPPRIKKALAIGIHGMFPAPLLRTVIGQPTGTSIRFSNHAAAAIQRWADKRNMECEIEKVALEGEGKIGERVDSLWRLLLNWIDHVRNADFILVACHSQGVPVALMLIAKLIEFGVVSSARIGICAMAGVSLGPFIEYKSRFFSGSAAELFDFAIHDSEVSRRYEDSLRIALKYGVRVTYVGSIDDQLVSLESAIFSPANHPYIYRAVFVNGRVHAPDFIAHLVGFALKLRNIGVSDHGLIRELSAPLAGSLYTGEGHSRLYDEEKIYDLSISFTLETSSVGDVPLVVQKYEAPTNNNPFQLPWSMRGLLEEDVVKTELTQETTELLQQFDLWKPATKVLKDVKYRLEAVRSKL